MCKKEGSSLQGQIRHSGLLVKNIIRSSDYLKCGSLGES